MNFTPQPALGHGSAHPDCRAIVIVPARNEREALPATLDGLAAQVDGGGFPLNPASFEILLLLNNCTDDSAHVAWAWAAAHPRTALRIFEREFAPAEAHVGTARRLLMDTAWHRLCGREGELCGILSTDADTIVDPEWIFQNMQALASGADAVGGLILLDEAEQAHLPAPVREARRLDFVYQLLMAEWEDRHDPQVGDPWPRHLEHYGASLACTPEVYARAGGLPAVEPLEDVAFIDALLRVDARLRHEPKVKVRTSARLEGRVQTGLSGQLRCWRDMDRAGEEQRVPSLVYLTHRFRTLRRLRRFWAGELRWSRTRLPTAWRLQCAAARREEPTCGRFLAAIDCNRLIDDSFVGEGDCTIEQAIDDLTAALALQPQPESVPA